MMNARILEVLAAFPGAGNGFFVLDAQGMPVGDVSFVTMWFLKGISWLGDVCGLTGMIGITATPEVIMNAGSILSVLILLAVVWGWALTFHGTTKAAAVSVLLFATTYGVATAFYEDVQLVLFTLLTLCAVLVLHIGYSAVFAPVRLTFGYLLACLATMTYGPLGLIIPMLASLATLIVKGDWRRIGSIDGAIGFGVSIALLATWVAFLVIPDKAHSISDPMGAFMTLPFGLPTAEDIIPLELAKAFGSYAAPWLVLILGIPYERIRELPAEIRLARSEHPSAVLPYTLLLAGMLCLVFAWYGTRLFAPLIVAAFALPAASILTSMSPRRLKISAIVLGVLVLAALVVCGVTTLLPHLTQTVTETADMVKQSVTETTGKMTAPDSGNATVAGWLDTIRSTVAGWIDGVKGLIGR